ncbi:MAG: hypothetical protein ISR95_04895 [Candidatus Marinimicrobia bacterium]|nr:hypothetical protein [Candidatus Neomarinimicrobiota bacterium]
MLGCENIEFMSLFIGIILYAEIHYRFPFFPFSRYHIREPEIISDAPYRLESGNSLPILILIKDARTIPMLSLKYYREEKVKLGIIEG